MFNFIWVLFINILLFFNLGIFLGLKVFIFNYEKVIVKLK